MTGDDEPLRMPAGEALSVARSGLSCCFCTDDYCIGKLDEAAIEPAFTLVPFTQMLQGPGGHVMVTVALPSCLRHRREQVRPGGLARL